MKMSSKKKSSKKNQKKNQKSNNTKTAIIIGIVGAVVAIAILLIVIFAGGNSAKTTSSNETASTASTTSAVDDSAETTSTTTGGEDNPAETTANAKSDVDNSAVETGTYTADIEIENYGTITVELDGEAAPITVDNFVSLAKSGFYDGLTFHRIIEDFMMQGGDPLGNGTGGSDEEIKGEFSANGVENNLSHTRGAISMARSSDFDSASSQFFIVHQDATYLDGQYAVFGYVSEGMDVVDKVCEDATPTDSNGTIESEDQPVIKSITIR